MPKVLTLPSDGLAGFFHLVEQINHRQSKGFIPFYVDDVCIGSVEPQFAAVLRGFATVFCFTETGQISLHRLLTTRESRTEAVMDVFQLMHMKGMLPNWRGELFPVTIRWSDPPLFDVERSALAFLGLRSYGVHLNGYVIKNKGSRETAEVYYWVARRSAQKADFPLKLDQIVAGGQPNSIRGRIVVDESTATQNGSPRGGGGGGATTAAPVDCVLENLIKECKGEAGLPRSLSEQAVPVGMVSYTGGGEFLRPHACSVYDLELPESFVPVLKKHVVDEFMLWPIQKVLDSVGTTYRTHEWKPNCALVVVDFLIRHGFISPSTPHYAELVASLQCAYAAGLTTTLPEKAKFEE